VIGCIFHTLYTYVPLEPIGNFQLNVADMVEFKIAQKSKKKIHPLNCSRVIIKFCLKKHRRCLLLYWILFTHLSMQESQFFHNYLENTMK